MVQFECHLHDRHRIVVEDRRDILGRELVGCVTDQQASLAHSTVTDYNASENRVSVLYLSNATCDRLPIELHATAVPAIPTCAIVRSTRPRA